MIQDLKLMGCGNCGCNLFRIYKAKDGLVSECENCKNTSHIRVAKPSIVIEWGDNSDGILAVDKG